MKNKYDFTNKIADQGSFMDERGEMSEWRTMGNFVSGFGQSNSDGDQMWEVLEGDAADVLSNDELTNYGLKALRWYWEALKVKPVSTFDKFVDQVYYDAELKTNFKDEDLPEFGRLVAMYLLDHPYPDAEKLQNNLKDLANKNPTGKIPTRWSLGQTIALSAKETSFFDYFSIAKTAVVESGKDFKELVVIVEKGAKMAVVYKVATVAILGLTLINSLVGRKKA